MLYPLLTSTFHILAIDPGTGKLGIAVLDSDCDVLEKNILGDISKLDEIIKSILNRFEIRLIAIGNGTGYSEISGRIKTIAPAVEIATIDETGTTELARKRYWAALKPGIRTINLIGSILGLIDVEFDDEVAVEIGLRYILSINKSE